MKPISIQWRATALTSALAALACGLALRPAPAGAHHVEWPVRPYYDFVHAVSMQDADGATAQFARDAVVIDGARCTTQAPCRGRDEIRERYVVPLLASGRGAPVVDQRFDGHELRARGVSQPPGGVGTEHVFRLGHTGIEALTSGDVAGGQPHRLARSGGLAH